MLSFPAVVSVLLFLFAACVLAFIVVARILHGELSRQELDEDTVIIVARPPL